MSTLRQQFLTYNGQTSPTPLLLEFTRAKGSFLYTANDEAYIDFISGIAVSHIGHGHPKVIAAIKQQADAYLHQMVYGEYVQSPQVQYAKLLVAHLPDSLNSVFFTNSGAEAIDGAMKLAKRTNGRTEMIAFKNSYHGSLQGPLSLMGNEYYKEAYRPLLPNVTFLEFNNSDDLLQITEQTCFVMAETIQGEAGIIVPNNAYMQALRARCTEVGALLILDENQCAFGRTGTMWGFENFDIIPDILVLGKALGGGLPLGAFIANKAVMDGLSDNPILGHLSTFGGHPLSCAAGIAAFEVLINEDIKAHVNHKGQLIKQHLASINTVHGMGLMLGLPLGSYEVLKPIIDRSIAAGVITDWFLHNSHTMRICPPLNISEEEITIACEAILKSV